MSEWENIESLENWAAWGYLREELNWPVDKIAYELNVNERRLIEWVNARAASMNKQAAGAKDKVKKYREQIEKRFPKPEINDAGFPNIKVNDVVKALLDGNSFAELAGQFKADPVKFKLWYGQNLQLINELYRKAVQGRPQTLTERA